MYSRCAVCTIIEGEVKTRDEVLKVGQRLILKGNLYKVKLTKGFIIHANRVVDVGSVFDCVCLSLRLFVQSI